METVPFEKFGRDHWSLLAYVECRCVDHGGEIDKRHLRCNAANHPMHDVNSNIRVAGESLATWVPNYGTRLKGHTSATPNALPDHDDWDTLNDLEEAGLLTVISEANGFVALTDTGTAVVELVRDHKAKGGSFGTFELKELPVDPEMGVLSALNVNDGDIRINFNKDDPADLEKAKAMIADMLKRGYTVLADDGKGNVSKVVDFDPNTCSYLVQDGPPKSKKTKSVPAKKAKTTGVAPQAGG